MHALHYSPLTQLSVRLSVRLSIHACTCLSADPKALGWPPRSDRCTYTHTHAHTHTHTHTHTYTCTLSALKISIFRVHVLHSKVTSWMFHYSKVITFDKMYKRTRSKTCFDYVRETPLTICVSSFNSTPPPQSINHVP